MEPSGLRKVDVERVDDLRPRPIPLTEAANDNGEGLAAFRPPGANDNYPVRRISGQDAPVRPRDAAIRAERELIGKRFTNDVVPAPNLAYPTVDQSFRNTYVDQGVGPSILAQANQNTTTRPPINGGEPQITQRTQVMRSGSPLRGSGKDIEGNPNPSKKSFRNSRGALTKALPGGFKEGDLKGVADRAYAASVVARMFPVGAAMWLMLQLPFAILALVFFGVASAVEGAQTGVVGKAISFVASAFSSLIDAALNVDISQFNPQNFFILTNSATMFIGYATLLGVGLFFTVSGIACLSGKASGLKYATLIVALVGYSIPVLNVFPWVLGWVLVVWLYPTE